MRENYITFIDNGGRTILAEKTEDNGSWVTVKNPVMIVVQQQENGQMAVQLFPLFFAEFVQESDGRRDNFFTYNKQTIAVGSQFSVDQKILDQYQRVTNPQLVPVESSNDGDTVRLFDED